MSRKGRSSDSRRCQRSDGRHSNMSDRSASVAFDTASTHPSISDGWTSISSTNTTTPSDISTDFDPNPQLAQPQGPFSGFGAFPPPHPQAAFYGQQTDSWQGHPSQSGPYQEYDAAPGYDAASNAEATGYGEYGSPGNSDDLANSTFVSYDSPPPQSPLWRQPSIPIDDNTNSKDSTEHNKKGWSHMKAPSPVWSWRPDPRNIPSTHRAVMEGYTYQQSPSPYPPVIADADVREREDQEKDMDNVNNNRDAQPYQAQGPDEDWDRCEVDDSSCTRWR